MFAPAPHRRAGGSPFVRSLRSLFAASLGWLLALGAIARIGVEYQMVLGNPSGATADPDNHDRFLLQRPQFAMDYSDNHRGPNWVSWSLTTADTGGTRTDHWASDPDLPSGFAIVGTSSYGGGYDRGHMCPSADRTVTTADNWVVFYISNIVPQASDNNQGPWERFESECRSLAAAGNELLIVCGPRGFSGATIGASNTAIPAAVWKIVVVVPSGPGTALSRIHAGTRVIAIDIPNIAGIRSNPWTNYVTSAAQIEAQTGLTFFTELPAALASVLRVKIDGQVVTGAPAIAVPPSPQTTTLGGNASFTITATGTPPLAYQWFKGNEPLAGAVEPTLALANVQLSDIGGYAVIVSNAFGAVTSPSAALSFTGPPAIAVQPASQSVDAGDNVDLTVVATGTAPLAYTWSRNGVELGTSSEPTLPLLNVQESDTGAYRVVVANGEGSVTSATALLTVDPSAPVIVSDPASRSVAEGSAVAFTVAAKGTAPLHYRWRKGGAELADGSFVSGSATATLALANVELADAGAYDVVVTNSLGAETVGLGVSEPATLTVSPVPSTSVVYWNFDAGTDPNVASPTSGLPLIVAGGALTHANNNGTTQLLTSVSVSSGYTGVSGTYNAGAAARIGALNTAAAGSAYFTFTFTPPAGTKLTVSNLAFGSRSTGTGPQAYAVFTSADNFAAPKVSGVFANNGVWAWHAPAMAPAAAATGAPITVRIYGYAGAGSPAPGTANWRIDDLRVTIDTVVQPSIRLSPLDQNAALGSTVVFSVAAGGSAPLAYQWRLNGLPLPVGGDGATLTLTDVQPDSAGTYDVVVTNSAGTAASTPANLRVTQSFASWAATWSLVGGDAAPTADPDGDGMANLLEYALGLHPTVASAGGRPSLAIENGLAVFRFTRPRTATGVTYRIQTSTDLSSWVLAAAAPVVEASTATTETLAVTLATLEPPLFVRLQVSAP